MDIEYKADITAMAYRLVKIGWLTTFLWGDGGIALFLTITDRGKLNFNLLDSLLHQKGVIDIADLDVTKIAILNELGTLTNADLRALSILVLFHRESQGAS